MSETFLYRFLILFEVVILIGELILLSMLPVRINVIPDSEIPDLSKTANSLKRDPVIHTNTLNAQISFEEVKDQIRLHLGDSLNNYGIYYYDLTYNLEFGINEDDYFRSASIIKMPIAILTLKEIELGNLSLDSIYPLRKELIFNPEAGIGVNPPGSLVIIDEYLTSMLTESDNTSLMHLDKLLGQQYDVNSRIIEILDVDPFFVNPPETTPAIVGKVFKNLYLNEYLNTENTDYIISLLQHADPYLRRGIGSSLPDDASFANKVGFLDTNEDLSYMDSAIVYTAKRDYVLIILDKNQPWDIALENIKAISAIIYNWQNQL